MTDDTRDATSRITRRSLGGAAITATLGGITLVAAGSESAAGEVELGEFEIEEAEYREDDPEVVPELSVTGEFEYQTEDRPDSVRVTLRVGALEASEDIDYETITVSSRSGATDFDVSGRPTEAADFHASTFQPDRGEEITAEVVTEVLVEVRTDGGAVLAETSVEDTAEITVENTGDANTVRVSAVGDVTFVAD